jgi:hypothetical protein
MEQAYKTPHDKLSECLSQALLSYACGYQHICFTAPELFKDLPLLFLRHS